MSEELASYRQILRSTSIVGGATAGSIAIGLVRMKIITLLIGPAGVGLFGVFNAVVMAGSLVAGLGIATSGVTELAAVSEDDEPATRVRGAIWSMTWLLAIVGGLLLWVFRERVAIAAAGSAEHASAIGWLGIAVSLSVVAASQSAVLQGFRRIADLGRVKLYGSLLAAILGVAAVHASSYFGIVAALIATPLASILVALVYSRRLPALRWRSIQTRSLANEWRALASLGFGVMLWTLMGSLTQIAVRVIIERDGGLDAAGLFQAGWTISANYQILIIAAMSADYLPRLSAAGADSGVVERLVDQQLHVGLLLAAPLLAAMIACAPLVLTILYSSEFTGATRFLQWQLAGDALKICGWSLGFVLLARKDMIFFLLAEAVFTLAYLALLHRLLPVLGLQAAGIAYFGAYCLYNVLIVWVCRRRHGVILSAANVRLIGSTVAVLLALALIGARWPIASSAMGLVAAALFAIRALRQLDGMTDAMPPALRSAMIRMRIL